MIVVFRFDLGLGFLVSGFWFDLGLGFLRKKLIETVEVARLNGTVGFKLSGIRKRKHFDSKNKFDSERNS